jgi:hypothetical protein
MAKRDYSADSAFVPPSRQVFAIGPDLNGSRVSVFEHGYMPHVETSPIIPTIV